MIKKLCYFNLILTTILLAGCGNVVHSIWIYSDDTATVDISTEWDDNLSQSQEKHPFEYLNNSPYIENLYITKQTIRGRQVHHINFDIKKFKNFINSEELDDLGMYIKELDDGLYFLESLPEPARLTRQSDGYFHLIVQAPNITGSNGTIDNRAAEWIIPAQKIFVDGISEPFWIEYQLNKDLNLERLVKNLSELVNTEFIAKMIKNTIEIETGREYEKGVNYLIERLESHYKRTFTDRLLQEINMFYESSTGQKYATISRELLNMYDNEIHLNEFNIDALYNQYFTEVELLEVGVHDIYLNIYLNKVFSSVLEKELAEINFLSSIPSPTATSTPQPTATSTPQPTATSVPPPTPTSQCPYSDSQISRIANNLSSKTKNARNNPNTYTQYDLRFALNEAKQLVKLYDSRCGIEIRLNDIVGKISYAEDIDLLVEQSECQRKALQKYTACHTIHRRPNNCRLDTSACQ